MSMPLTNKDRELRSAGEIADTLQKNRLRKLGLYTSGGKVTGRQAVMLDNVHLPKFYI